MSALIERRLVAIASRLGALLRGAGNPQVFIGTPETLAGEIGRLFDESIIRCEAGRASLTYREAITSCTIASFPSRVADDAVEALIDGLRNPPTLAATPRPTLDATSVERDLAELLRRARLNASLRGADGAGLAAALARALPPGEFEVRALPLGGGVALTGSFNALRAAVAMRAVEEWQVPGHIAPAGEGRGG